ncbi:Osmotin thaumatin-like protein [Trametes elegans]|nr:Osmotin thaumatin-like protein [Trametes elegans]
MKGFVSVACAVALASNAAARTFTVYNQCPFTIWPAIFTDLNVGSAVPSQPNGWQQNAFQTVSFFVPDNWRAGRIWARRDCNFNVANPGANSCIDGGCNGGLVCDPHTGTGVPPATLAEFTLDSNGQDSYDVSIVDGYNLPVRINNNKGCPVADCPVDLGPNCPAALKGPFDSTGFPVGCKSACLAGLGGDPNNNPDCCTGSHNTPATCPPSGVDYYSYFKNNCPNSYVYAYDDATGLKSCSAGAAADYTITFCP